MGMKRIFCMYVVEERSSVTEEEAAPIGCLTSTKLAKSLASKRYQEDRNREHRITKFHSANWSIGDSYEEFYSRTWNKGKPFTQPELTAWLQAEFEKAPPNPIEVIFDWGPHP